MLNKLLNGLQAVQLLIVIGIFIWVGGDKERVVAEKERLALEVEKRTTEFTVKEKQLTVDLKQLQFEREAREKLIAEERALREKEIAQHEKAFADLAQQLNEVQQETLKQLTNSARRAELYALGTEMVKIVSSQQQCLTEDQYFVIDFVADLFNKSSPVELDGAHLQALARRRKGCEKAIATPITGSLLSGFVLLGKATMVCNNDTDVESKDADEKADETSQDESKQKDDEEKKKCKIQDFQNFSVKEGLDDIDSSLEGIEKLPASLKGAILQAKRDTNIRANKHDYELRTNPVIGKISANECVELQELYYARSKMWARVHLSKCP